MRYGQIRHYDTANGEGIRTTIFVTGCRFNCKDCFNKDYQDFNFGEIWTNEQTEEVIKYLSDETVAGLTILGGEPFQNVPELTEIVKQIKPYLRNNQNIWIYSGYTYEQLIEDKNRLQLLNMCDILVDGRFETDKKDLSLKFRGSSNQRIINLNEMR